MTTPESKFVQLGWGPETIYASQAEIDAWKERGLLEWCKPCREYHPAEVDGQRLQQWETIKKECKKKG